MQPKTIKVLGSLRALSAYTPRQNDGRVLVALCPSGLHSFNEWRPCIADGGIISPWLVLFAPVFISAQNGSCSSIVKIWLVEPRRVMIRCRVSPFLIAVGFLEAAGTVITKSVFSLIGAT